MGSGSRPQKLLVVIAGTATILFATPALAQSSGPAVSGFNTKFSGEGGLYDDEGAGFFQGSLTTPLGHAFGFQADGVVGGIDGGLDDDTLGGGALHLFTRDPSSYLLGIYASYHTWDSIDIARVAAEGELYMGRTIVSGIAGWEDVDVPGRLNGLQVITKDDDHFFTELDLSYYPGDNLRLAIGYHYEDEASLGVAQFEYMPQWSSLPGASLFATGYFGEEDYARITGGLRVYFGSERDKSLIRRHREDDPKTYNPVFPKLEIATPVVEVAEEKEKKEKPNFCPVNTELPPTENCVCPPPSQRVELDVGFVCEEFN